MTSTPGEHADDQSQNPQGQNPSPLQGQPFDPTTSSASPSTASPEVAGMDPADPLGLSSAPASHHQDNGTSTQHGNAGGEAASSSATVAAVPSYEEMMAQAQQLQTSMQQAQQQLSEAKVEGEAENGAVRALVSGTGVLLDLRIAPAVINPQEPQRLISLILAAVQDAGEKATAMQERVLNEISPEMVSMLNGEQGTPGAIS